jgi:hypothetical protein
MKHKLSKIPPPTHEHFSPGVKGRGGPMGLQGAVVRSHISWTSGLSIRGGTWI